MPSAPPSVPNVLDRFKTTKDFFVGIDSDGCVFNSMEVKHNDCFSVALVRAFELGEISRQVHEVWDFVNLYSRTRGCNRFLAIASAFDRLRQRPVVANASVRLSHLRHLKDWTARESKLSNQSLSAEVQRATGDRKQELESVLRWSILVDELIDVTVTHLPPFLRVRDCLALFAESADSVVISSTPTAALNREWTSSNLTQYVALIGGQELGNKKELLRSATEGRYEKDRVLMVGDAPGDLSAAQHVGGVFYPIVPGRELESWARLFDEGAARFFAGTYRGEYQNALLEDFIERLPEEPSWQVL